MQMQVAANSSVAPLQRLGDGSDSESEHSDTSSVGSFHTARSSFSSSDESDTESVTSFYTANDGTDHEALTDTHDEFGVRHATRVDASMGAHIGGLTTFREVFADAKAVYERAEALSADLNLILDSIHREYGSWFGNANRGSEAEVVEKNRQFADLERRLVAGESPGGKYWSVIKGLEGARGDMMVALASIKAPYESVSSLLESCVRASERGTSSDTYTSSLLSHSQELALKMHDEIRDVVRIKEEAQGLLGEGREKFGGKKATAPIALSPDAVESGTLMSDERIGYALTSLKAAIVDYHESCVKKEELRDRLGVGHLKDRKAKKAARKDAAVATEITDVRTEKKVATARYKSLKAKVKAMLSEEMAPEMKEEIMEMDRIYLGASPEEAAANMEAAEARRTGAKSTAKKLTKVSDQLAISEATFARLRRSMAPLTEAGVGANTFGMNLGVNFQIGAGKASSVTIGGGIKYSGSVNLQDDRRFRVSHSCGVYGSGSADIAGVLGASLGVEMMRGKTEVFMDADHWAATMAFRFNKICEEIKSLDSAQALIQDEFGPDESASLLKTSHLAEDSVTNVSSTSATGSFEVSALGMGVSGSKSSSSMTFSKAGDDKTKKAKQSVKTISVSPGGNLGLTFTRTIIDGHANPDNDGAYWNIGMSLTGSASASLAAVSEESGDTEFAKWEEKIKEFFGSSTDSSSGDTPAFTTAEQDLFSSAKSAADEKNFGDVVSAISTYLGAEVAKLEASIPASFDLSGGLSGSKSVSVQWNWVMTDAGKNQLQYRRFDKGSSLGVSASAPVGTLGAASVGVEAGASKGTSRMVSEKLGTETLTYFITVFNGLNPRTLRDRRVGREDTPDQWSAYCDKHKKEVWVLLCKIGKGQGGGYAELIKWIEGVNAMRSDMDETISSKATTTSAAAERMIQVCREQLATVDESTVDAAKYATVKAALTNYFTHQGDLNNHLRKSEWS